MGKRGVLLVSALLAVTLWPAAGGAADDPPPTTVADDLEAPATTVPDATVPDTTLPLAPVPATEEPSTAVPVAPPEASTPPSTEARTLTASPNTGLVHDQVVILRGTGWGSRTALGAAQCVQGATSTDGCGSITFFSSDLNGRFRSDFEMAVILETWDGTFDCRVVACVVAANNEFDTVRAQVVDLDFDPAGPDPVRRAATVTPDTSLIDAQEVTVAADGIPTGGPGQRGYVEMLQCRTPVLARTADCDLGTADYAETDTAGHLDHLYEVETVLYLPGGETHDCRTGGCSLAVYSYDDTLAEGALVPLGFDPLGPVRPPPILTVDPASDLVDGEIVTIDGTGWPARAYVGVIPCVTGASDINDCDFEYHETFRADAAGHIEGRVGVAAELWLGPGDQVDCRATACSLFALVDGWIPRAVEVPLDFVPDGPLLSLSVEVTPSTGLHDGDEVLVSGGHARPDAFLRLAQCAADTSYFRGCDVANQDYLETPLQGRADVGLSFAATFTVHRVFRDLDGRLIDCALVPCVLIVNGEIDSIERAARVPLGFAAVPVDPIAPIGATPPFTG